MTKEFGQASQGTELANLVALYRDLPKVELHIHMEGAMSAKTLFDLAKKNGVELPVENIEQLSDALMANVDPALTQ